MKGRVELWNRFVAIERQIRLQARSILDEESELAVINDLKSRIATLRSEIAEAGNARRGQTVNAQRSQVRAYLSELTQRMREFRAARKERLARLRPALKQIELHRSELVKTAQRESGIFWCNYDDVRHAYEVSRVRAMRSGSELQEHAWEGSGKVSVRFQDGLPVEHAFSGSDGRLQIDPIPAAAWTSPRRSERRLLSRTRVRLRVASRDRSPVWFEIPIVLHRSLPPHGSIRSASILRERVGLSWRYLFLVTVSVPEGPTPVKERPSIAMDLGWRVVPEGLRVAYWADSCEQYGELVIPRSDLSEFRKSDELWSLINDKFELARSRLSIGLDRLSMPDSLTQNWSVIKESHSPAQYLAFVRLWQEQRFDQDEELFSVASEWTARHIHLWTWAVNLRDQLARRRLELYRRFAAEIVKKYGAIYLEKFDLRSVFRHAPPEGKTVPLRRQYRGVAAVGSLRLVLADACRRSGVKLTLVKPRNTTRTCHACGTLESWNVAKEIKHTCSCGTTWDQDHNAAVQILRLGQSSDENLSTKQSLLAG